MSKRRLKDKIDNRWMSRRQFLIGAGYTTLLLPPLYSLMPSSIANAAQASPRKRFLVFISYRGIDVDHMYPNPTDMTPYTSALHTFYKPLSSFANGNVSYMVDSSFKDLFPYMNVMRGLSMTDGEYRNHNDTLLAGYHRGRHNKDTVRPGTTIDCVLEQSPAVYGPSEVIAKKAVRIADDPAGFNYSYSTKPGQKGKISTGTYGDLNLYNQLFLGLPDQPKGSGPTAPSQAALHQQSIVDQVMSDLNGLQKHRAISSQDKILLDDYIESVHELNKKVKANVSGGGGGICSKKDLEAIAFQSGSSGNPNYFPVGDWGIKSTKALFENYNKMIRLAFMCDLTRVVYVFNQMWRDEAAPIVTSGVLGLHHECPGKTESAKRHKWGLMHLRDLANSLRTTTDPFGGGNILDNSLLFYTNELGDWTTGHNVTNMPAITFGKGGGYFNTGYFVDYRQRPLPSDTKFQYGRPYKQLLQSIMLSMGVSEAEYSKYGENGGFGAFYKDITQDNKGPNAFVEYQKEHNKALPFVSKG